MESTLLSSVDHRNQRHQLLHGRLHILLIFAMHGDELFLACFFGQGFVDFFLILFFFKQTC